jgi:ABC-type phosphate/phosphonate transport system ATPase subunit
MQHQQNVTIEDVVRQLSAANPVAVILGTPGSGKSTALRWLALHMAKYSVSQVLSEFDKVNERR